MKIVFLDAKTLGDDIDYTQFEQLGGNPAAVHVLL